MPHQARLIIQLARGGQVDERFARDRPRSIEDGEIVLDRRDPDENGRLVPPDAGQVVMSVLSPETFAREPDEVRRVIDGAGGGDEPLFVVVEAAEELRDDELAVVLEAADRSSRPVVLHIAAEA
jgi:hypothetical protein